MKDFLKFVKFLFKVFDKIIRVIFVMLHAGWGELTRSESSTKGNDFEYYVKSDVFPEDGYDMIEETHDYQYGWVASMLKPDFQFRDIKSGKEFWVECKYSTQTNKKGVKTLFNPKQLKRHKKINKKEPVYLCLGVKGPASIPDDLYIIPISLLSPYLIPWSLLKKYKVNLPIKMRVLK